MFVEAEIPWIWMLRTGCISASSLGHPGRISLEWGSYVVNCAASWAALDNMALKKHLRSGGLDGWKKGLGNCSKRITHASYSYQSDTCHTHDSTKVLLQTVGSLSTNRHRLMASSWLPTATGISKIGWIGAQYNSFHE